MESEGLLQTTNQYEPGVHLLGQLRHKTHRAWQRLGARMTWDNVHPIVQAMVIGQAIGLVASLVWSIGGVIVRSIQSIVCGHPHGARTPNRISTRTKPSAGRATAGMLALTDTCVR